VAALIALRREALYREPLAFAASPDDDRGLSITFMRTALAHEDEHAVFGCPEPGVRCSTPPSTTLAHGTRDPTSSVSR